MGEGGVYWFARAHIVSEPPPKDPGWFSFPKSLGLIFKPAASPGKTQPMSDVPVIGLDADVPVRFAEGGSVPGDRIVGILTPGEGVTVYRIDPIRITGKKGPLPPLAEQWPARNRTKSPGVVPPRA